MEYGFLLYILYINISNIIISVIIHGTHNYMHQSSLVVCLLINYYDIYIYDIYIHCICLKCIINPRPCRGRGGLL